MRHGEALVSNGAMLSGCSDGRGVRLSPEGMTVEPLRGLAQGCATPLALCIFRLLELGQVDHLRRPGWLGPAPGKTNELSTSGMFIDTCPTEAQVRDAVVARHVPKQWSRPAPVCFRGVSCCFLLGVLLQAIVRATTSACQRRATLGGPISHLPPRASLSIGERPLHHRSTPEPVQEALQLRCTSHPGAASQRPGLVRPSCAGITRHNNLCRGLP